MIVYGRINVYRKGKKQNCLSCLVNRVDYVLNEHMLMLLYVNRLAIIQSIRIASQRRNWCVSCNDNSREFGILIDFAVLIVIVEEETKFMYDDVVCNDIDLLARVTHTGNAAFAYFSSSSSQLRRILREQTAQTVHCIWIG